MEKIFILYLFSIIFFLSKGELMDIEAQLDSESNNLIYNGKIYKMSNETLPEKYTEEETSFFDSFWFNFIGFTILACFAGAMSGLTVGYLSIDMLILEIKLDSGTEQEKIYAKKIKRVINDHHWILVTLLLCNAFACEAMPILLDKLVSDIMAIVVSVTVLLFVGEIVPQALCTGPNQMKIAAFLAPFTYGLMIITFPLSYPIAKFMDLVVGKHSKTRFCNSDLKSVIELHLKEYKGHPINTKQIGYFTGFLDIINTKVKELTIPIEKVYKLNYNQAVNYHSIKEIKETGFSRIPIYEDDPNNLIGILFLKDLVGKDLSHPVKLNELNINILNVIHINEETFLFDLLEQFQNGKSKMAFVYREISKDETLLPDERITIKEVNKEIDKEKEEEKIDIKEPLSINDNENKNENKEEIVEQLLNDNAEEIKKEEENLNEEEAQEKKIKEEKMILDKDENNDRQIIGIITLEDLIESLLKIHFKEEGEIVRKSIRKSTM